MIWGLCGWRKGKARWLPSHPASANLKSHLPGIRALDNPSFAWLWFLPLLAPSLQVLVVDFRSELVGVAVDACEIGLEHAA